MKCTIPEISWHNREPVLSVDIFPETGESYRLASGGGDCHVLIWQMIIASNGAVNQELVSDLTRHQRAVNCVRWSGTGKYLASGDDDANIIIWQLKTDNIPLLEGDTDDKEIWNVFKIMRGHKEDVYDICWSIDDAKILSGSVDNTAILWNVNKGKMDQILSDHKGFVQGVAWDPKNQFIATISTDRICRIFDTLGKHVKSRIYKGKLTSVPDDHFLKDKEAKYFHDDTFKSFFRRLQFTPDGSLLIVPSGHIEVDNCKTVNATLIFTLDNLSCPSIILPIPKQSSTVVRVCPVLYELRDYGPDPIIKLPYRMVFAVGTDHDIILYDTQQTLPFARFQDIHYTRLTDLSWSQDGLLLIASSTDGFCSLITFELDELGVPWIKMEGETEENPLDISGCGELQDKDENIDTTNNDVKKLEENNDMKVEAKKRPSFLEQWALKTPKKRKIDEHIKNQENSNDKKTKEIIVIGNSPEKMDVPKPEETINKLVPRRVAPIKLEDKIPNHNNTKEKINSLEPKRIKPRLIEPKASTSKIKDNRKEESTKSNNEKESSDSEDQNDYYKASQNIKEFFSKKPQTPEKTANDITASKEKINVLIPRRIKCIQNVELQPNVDNIMSKSEEQKSEKESENKLSLEGQAELHKGLEDNKEKNDNNFGNGEEKRQSKEPESTKVEKSILNEHSDSKLIVVIEKSKEKKYEESPGLEGGSSSEENKANTNNEAKLIEVKSISNEPEEKKDEEKPCLGELKNEKNKATKQSDDAKPITVKKKLKRQETNQNEQNPKTKLEEKFTKKPVFKIKLNEKVNSEKDDVICLDDTNREEYNTTPKKIKLSKSSSAKTTPGKIKGKSSDVTPKKQTTTLLKFLKKSSEKPKTKTEEKICQIEVVLDEAGARDAWSCDDKAKINTVETKNDDQIFIDDDKTEDFCLQLEESQEAINAQKKDTNSEEKNSDKTQNLVENIKATLKTPRRVPFVTLASPSSKNKKAL